MRILIRRYDDFFRNASAKKTPNLEKGEIGMIEMEKNDLPTDTLGIKQAIESTKDEIRNAILNGDADGLIQLDNRMRILSARLFGSEVSAAKSIIDKSESDKIKIQKDIENLREIKKQKNLKLGKAQILYQLRLEKVNKAEFEIQLSQNLLESARVAIRENKAKLQKLLDEKQKETSTIYKQYELAKY